MKRGFKLLLLVLTLFLIQDIAIAQLKGSICEETFIGVDCHETGYMVEKHIVSKPHTIDGGDCFIGTIYKQSCEAGCNNNGCIVKQCSSDIECEKNMMCDIDKNQCYNVKICEKDNNCYFDQKCVQGNCRAIECEYGNIKNHICYQFECHNFLDCNQGETCYQGECTHRSLCKSLDTNGEVYRNLDILIVGKSYNTFENFRYDLDKIFLINESKITNIKYLGKYSKNINLYYIDNRDLSLFSSGDILFEDIKRLHNNCPVAEIIIIITSEDVQNKCDNNICVFNTNTDYSFLIKTIKDYFYKITELGGESFMQRGASFYLFMENGEIESSEINIISYYMDDYSFNNETAFNSEQYSLKFIIDGKEIRERVNFFFPANNPLLKYNDNNSFVRILLPSFRSKAEKIQIVDEKDVVKHEMDVSNFLICNKNGVCEDKENIIDCLNDCRCGNDICEKNEDNLLCPFDCPKISKIKEFTNNYVRDIFAVLLILVVTFFLIIYKNKKNKFTKKLEKYIKDAKEKGFSDNVIEQKLIQHGYEPEFLKKYFNNQNKN